MTHRLARLLAVVCMASALVAVPTAAHADAASAQAVTPRDRVVLFEGTLLHCVEPFLVSPFDRVSQCLQVVGSYGRVGVYNERTFAFTASTGFHQLVNANFFTDPYVCATDGVCGVIGGYGVLATPYGATVFGLQYVSNIGRWGNWNLHTDTFYPGGAWVTTG